MDGSCEHKLYLEVSSVRSNLSEIDFGDYRKRIYLFSFKIAIFIYNLHGIHKSMANVYLSINDRLPDFLRK